MFRLQVGDMWLAPGGWKRRNGGHAILILYERTAEDAFGVTIFNTGGGVQYHPATVGSYPKYKHRTAWHIPQVLPDDLLSPAFLYGLLCFTTLWSPRVHARNLSAGTCC